jgi:predicted RNA-binding Zn ribbon-like protein
MVAGRPSALDRIGGITCLDFVNTVDPRYANDRIEYLSDYPALLEWSVANRLLDPQEADRLALAARRRPSQARQVHRRAVALREALFELLRREPGPARSAALETLNRELTRSPQLQIVMDTGGAFERRWPASLTLDRVLWGVVFSASDLLASDRLGRVRECRGETCGWLFLDTSKAGRRRWCSMADCGNRAKAKRRRAVREALGET